MDEAALVTRLHDVDAALARGEPTATAESRRKVLAEWHQREPDIEFRCSMPSTVSQRVFGVRRRQIESDLGRDEVGPAAIVAAPERSAVMATAESRWQDTTHENDLDGHRPELGTTRVVGMAGPSETILKARLLSEPLHPRAPHSLDRYDRIGRTDGDSSGGQS
ncbi:MAG: hypothetical protein EHM50_11190 [Lysobacterales bacterium]|nr:MAG: hypothetical protein EHM50_11190 [Xanthomonadales bacterium]